MILIVPPLVPRYLGSSTLSVAPGLYSVQILYALQYEIMKDSGRCGNTTYLVKIILTLFFQFPIFEADKMMNFEMSWQFFNLVKYRISESQRILNFDLAVRHQI